MHVNLVAPPSGWILDKIAYKIHQHTGARLGVEPDPNADINYYFNWHVFTFHKKQPGLDLLFFTHINKGEEQLVYSTVMRADHATCISTYAMELLVDMGVPAEKLTLTLLPIDDDWQPRPIRLGIPCRWYEDGRRDEWMLIECARRGALDGYLIFAMGPEWEGVLQDLATAGVQVAMMQQTGNFIADYAGHHHNMQYMDYTIHCGIEGTIGIADGLATGVPTIHRRAGQALDMVQWPDAAHWFDTVDELEAILRDIMRKHRAIGEKARSQTWKVYAGQLEALWGRLCT